MRAFVRALWLMACISAHIARAQFPMRPMTRIYHKSRSLRHWHELRKLFRQEGIDLPFPPYSEGVNHGG
jgi:hypothetical protein